MRLWNLQGDSNDSIESAKDSIDSAESGDKIDCHEVVPTSRNDDICGDSTQNPAKSHIDRKPFSVKMAG